MGAPLFPEDDARFITRLANSDVPISSRCSITRGIKFVAVSQKRETKGQGQLLSLDFKYQRDSVSLSPSDWAFVKPEHLRGMKNLQEASDEQRAFAGTNRCEADNLARSYLVLRKYGLLLRNTKADYTHE